MSPSSDRPVIPAERADDLSNLHLAEKYGFVPSGASTHDDA